MNLFAHHGDDLVMDKVRSPLARRRLVQVTGTLPNHTISIHIQLKPLNTLGVQRKLGQSVGKLIYNRVKSDSRI